MRPFLYSLVVLLALVFGCASKYDQTPKLPPGIIHQQSPHITMHGDVEFPAADRLELEKAAEIWDVQTSGFVNIDIKWDLDFDNPIGLLEHQEDNLLVSISDKATQEEIDCQAASQYGMQCGDPKVSVLGQTRSDIHQTYPIRVFILTGKTSGHWLRHVAVHEFGHALGLGHLPNPASIMYFASPDPGPTASVCLKADDLNAFCAEVGGCKPEQMKPCE